MLKRAPFYSNLRAVLVFGLGTLAFSCGAPTDVITPSELASTSGSVVVSLTSPSATLRGGQVTTLNFSAVASKGLASLQLLYAADGETFSSVATPSVNATSYAWTVPSNNVTTAKLKLTATDIHGNASFATSSAFTVKPCQVAYYSKRALSGAAAGAANSSHNIWIINDDATGLLALTSVTVAADSLAPEISPDGTKVVYSSKRNLDGVPGSAANAVANIWIINVDGTSSLALTQLTVANADSTTPIFSRDGSKIFYRSKRNLDGNAASAANAAANIWVMNVDGTSNQALTQVVTSGADAFAPMLSNDGTKLAFLARRSLDGLNNGANTGTINNLWVMNSSDGSGLLNLTALTVGLTTGPVFSSDDTKIIYNSSRNLDGTNSSAANASTNLWSIKVDGTSNQALTSTVGANAGVSIPFSYSPTGGKIAYGTGRPLDGTTGAGTSLSNIWIMTIGGTDAPLTQVTTATASSYASLWRGTYIMYNSKRPLDGSLNGTVSNPYNIWRTDTSGAGSSVTLTQVTTAGADSFLSQGSVTKACSY